MRRPLISVGILTVAALTLLTTGCGKDKSTNPPPSSDYLAQSSPQNCLTNLITAYTHRNIDEYRKLFSTDFIFQTAPGGVIGPDHLPSQWDLSNELQMHTHMFDPGYQQPVTEITLSFKSDPIVSSENEFPGTWMVVAHNVQLRVETHPAPDSQLNYEVSDGLAGFYFKEYPAELAGDGQPLWRIVRWKDDPVGALARAKTEVTTWGYIKAHYH